MSRNPLKFALTTGGILAGAAAYSHGAIIETDISADPVSTNATGIVFFNPESQTTSTSGVGQFDLNFGGGKPSVVAQGSGPEIVGANGFAYNLPVGTTVGPSSPFVNSGSVNSSPSADNVDPFTANGTAAYVGFSLVDSNSQTDYGYAEISYNTDANLSLYGFAYDNSGAPIQVAAIGTVPEPSTAALMLIGAGSLVAFAARRQRRACSLSL